MGMKLQGGAAIEISEVDVNHTFTTVTLSFNDGRALQWAVASASFVVLWLILPSLLAVQAGARLIAATAGSSLVYVLLRKRTRFETLRVVRGLGILWETWASRPPASRDITAPGADKESSPRPLSSIFVPQDRLRTVLVHEAIQGCEVRFYLAMAVEGSDRLLLPFRSVRLRLPQLLQVQDAVLRTLALEGARPGVQTGKDERAAS